MATDFVWQTPTKPTTIEIIGGGDADGLYLETHSNDPGEADQALGMYQLTSGGKLGYSTKGASVGSLMRLRMGERLDPASMHGQPHYYTVVERHEEDNALLIRMLYTAGVHIWPGEETDPPQLGWANTAFRRSLTASYTGISKDALAEYWIGVDLEHGRPCAIEKSSIESLYRKGTLEEKCNKIADRLMDFPAGKPTYEITEEVVYFRPFHGNGLSSNAGTLRGDSPTVE